MGFVSGRVFPPSWTEVLFPVAVKAGPYIQWDNRTARGTAFQENFAENIKIKLGRERGGNEEDRIKEIKIIEGELSILRKNRFCIWKWKSNHQNTGVAVCKIHVTSILGCHKLCRISTTEI
jgi:hypothetical protein